MALILLLTLATAVVLCLVRAGTLGQKLNSRLGSTGWDFNQSWASNLAAVGAVLGAVIGALSVVSLPDLAVTAVVLSVLFGALTVFAPIAYSALQVDGSGTGTLGGFYLASGLTFWAALGEAVTGGAFFADLEQKLSPLVIAISFAVFAIGVVALVVYVWRSMGWVAAKALPPGAPLTPLHNWHLL